ncbi:hypothetical protein PAQ31011_03426 [Pandoraea aquatica]|uniref:Chromosome partition protein Smc n=1 Tax=Pandoraea aquatica TaxID=2508290 RepID=A0A5E4WMM9_9BURK|nr:hypothetical protein [Pandoraea aquatica]VVE26207.1 hypothetical protein PAQ31011_03426 [Pandoraea aquatica]
MYGEYISYPGYSIFSMSADQSAVPERMYKKGASIAQKRQEIASQLAQIRNAQQTMGLSTYAVDKLSSAFDKSYAKATSGYWRGGLRDPFWRCLTVPDSPGFFCSMVADQLDEPCVERMTSSARRLLTILTSLSEALEHEQTMLREYASLASNTGDLQNDALDGVITNWEALEDTKRMCSTFRTQTAPLIEYMRRTVDAARSSVKPDRKHHGKREGINGALYAVGAIVSGIALLVSGWVVAIIGFCVTMVIRCVSLGSIRGFDREKGWKAVEGLLDQAKEFINNQESAMYSTLTDKILIAQFDQDRLVWQQVLKNSVAIQQNSEDLRCMKEDVSAIKQAVVQTATSLHGDFSTLRGDVSTLRGDVSRLNNDVSKLGGDVSKLSGDVSKLSGDVSKLSGDVSKLGGDVSKLGGDVSTLREDFSTMRGDVSTLRKDFEGLRNTILFDKSSRQPGIPEGRPVSCGHDEVLSRAPMARATSLETYRRRQSPAQPKA